MRFVHPWIARHPAGECNSCILKLPPQCIVVALPNRAPENVRSKEYFVIDCRSSNCQFSSRHRSAVAGRLAVSLSCVILLGVSDMFDGRLSPLPRGGGRPLQSSYRCFYMPQLSGAVCGFVLLRVPEDSDLHVSLGVGWRATQLAQSWLASHPAG